MDKYVNFKLCTRKGKRIAVFARHIKNSTEIYILKCSKNDHFERRLARRVYYNYLSTGNSELKTERVTWVDKDGKKVPQIVPVTKKFTPEIHLFDLKMSAEDITTFLMSQYLWFVCDCNPKWGANINHKRYYEVPAEITKLRKLVDKLKKELEKHKPSYGARTSYKRIRTIASDLERRFNREI